MGSEAYLRLDDELGSYRRVLILEHGNINVCACRISAA